MSLTQFFKKMKAPLCNQIWSWGSTMSDGTVLLRVWQDQVQKIDGKKYVAVADHNYTQNSPGYGERLAHIQSVRQGAKCYLVMCLAKDKEAMPRSIKSYNKDYLFVGGGTIEKDGKIYMEIIDKKSVERVLEEIT